MKIKASLTVALLALVGCGSADDSASAPALPTEPNGSVPAPVNDSGLWDEAGRPLPNPLPNAPGDVLDSGATASDGASDGGTLSVACAATTAGTNACGCKPNGTLYCWGENGLGQLGNGSTASSSTPVVVSGAMGRVAEVIVLGQSACARTAAGSVWCWGANGRGQLGDGTTIQRTSPVLVSDLGTNVVQLSGGDIGGPGGDIHFCAVRGDGTAYCWGSNVQGELGDGSKVQRSKPVQVAALGTSVLGISTGGAHTCALKKDRTVWCWGDGRFGLGGPQLSNLAPTQIVSLGASVATLAAGTAHECAAKLDGTLWCWGYNPLGQLGDGTSTDRLQPVQVTGVSGVVGVSASGFHTCSLGNTGAIFCWGAGSYGQLGNGLFGTSYSTPAIAMASGARSVSAGGSLVAQPLGASCATKLDGSVWCWGAGQVGQRGDGSTTVRISVPVLTLL